MQYFNQTRSSDYLSKETAFTTFLKQFFQTFNAVMQQK